MKHARWIVVIVVAVLGLWTWQLNRPHVREHRRQMNALRIQGDVALAEMQAEERSKSREQRDREERMRYYRWYCENTDRRKQFPVLCSRMDEIMSQWTPEEQRRMRGEP